jgi:hypothetical protein
MEIVDLTLAGVPLWVWLVGAWIVVCCRGAWIAYKKDRELAQEVARKFHIQLFATHSPAKAPIPLHRTPA